MGLDCRKCTPAQKREHGCFEDSLIKGKWVIDGERYSRCPLTLITAQSVKLIEAYQLVQSGMGTPYGGGYLKHSKKFLDAMRTIHGQIEKRKAKDVKQC